ncbi:hypothetical protein Bca52824_026413 [Brassica carinata]|uniref:Uncharacterized protein n=1 Tax=Brassica carinata TaxID=52824 RepID=A0A8X7SHM4_BRACI|nr:hypothetical protein Bca52824_026413 [Brassica carinata]
MRFILTFEQPKTDKESRFGEQKSWLTWEAGVIDGARIDCRAEREGLEIWAQGLNVSGGERKPGIVDVYLYLGALIVYFHWMGGLFYNFVSGNAMSVAEGQLNGGSRHHA